MEKNQEHAFLSASGSSRWINCTPSARLEEKFEEKESSVFAKEGTLAHNMAEIILNYKLGRLNTKIFNANIKKIKTDPLYSPEMDEEVGKYVDHIMQEFSDAKEITLDARILIEEKLDFSDFVKDGFGTGDSSIIADGVLNLDDLKYGKGIKVEAPENTQLMLYGLGALKKFELMYDIHTLKLTIFQPRLDHVSSWIISVKDLLAWGEKIKPIAKKAYKGEGEQNSGDWCKWCKVKNHCKALANINLELAKHDFQEPALFTEEEIIDIYSKLSLFQDWAKSISKYVLDEALKGKKFKGYKLVAGKSNRKWADEKKIMAKFKKLGFKTTEFINSKLIGITAAEKLVTKKEFPKIFEGLVIKPPGAPTLVTDKDIRPAMGLEQAKEDFK